VAAPSSRRRVAVVVSRFNDTVTNLLLEGARDALRRHGLPDSQVDVVWVPGAFELPVAAEAAAAGGRYDAIVALGCVIRGETAHFEYVAGEAARGIADVGRVTGVPATFGVITAETMEQAMARAGGKVGNRGEEAALAALELVSLLERLDGRAVRPRTPRG